MAGGYWHVILITFVGFVALAAVLLVPVWRFLAREEERADGFTDAVEGSGTAPSPAWVNDLVLEAETGPLDPSIEDGEKGGSAGPVS